MRVAFAGNVQSGCSALILLFALACSRAGDSCLDGQPCSPGGGEPAAALISMPGGAAPASGCGDGIRDPEREECDDGSACRDGRDCTEEPARCQVGGGDRSCAPRAGDGCSAECRVEPGHECPEQGACQKLQAPPQSEAPPDLELSPVPDGPAPSSSPGGAPLGSAGSGSSEEPPPAVPCELAPFGEPERVQGLEPGLLGIVPGGFQLWAPALSSDESTLLFAAALPGVPERIFSASRARSGRRFAGPTALRGVESGAGDGTPLLSQDGLRLYFYSRRAGGAGDRDLWHASRADTSADFGSPSVLAGVNSPALEHLPWLSADELTLLFVSTRAGGVGQSDLWLAQRAALDAPFAEPVLLRAVSSSADEGRGVLSSSGRTLIFASDRAGGQGLHDLWLATRAGDAAEHGEIRALRELNGPGMELDPFLTLDDRELFFVSDRGGRSEIWHAERQCDE